MSELDRNSEIDTVGNIRKGSLLQDSSSNKGSQNHQHKLPDLDKDKLRNSDEDGKNSIAENEKAELSSN